MSNPRDCLDEIEDRWYSDTNTGVDVRWLIDEVHRLRTAAAAATWRGPGRPPGSRNKRKPAIPKIKGPIALGQLGDLLRSAQTP